jgi:hypothetical protein
MARIQDGSRSYRDMELAVKNGGAVSGREEIAVSRDERLAMDAVENGARLSKREKRREERNIS